MLSRLAKSCMLMWDGYKHINLTLVDPPESGNTTNVLVEYASLEDPNKSTARVWETQICQPATRSGCVDNAEQHGVPGQWTSDTRVHKLLKKRRPSDNIQETLNYWKQLTHIMAYFRTEEDATARLPRNFISGFLEVSSQVQSYQYSVKLTILREEIDFHLDRKSSGRGVLCT